MDRNENLTEESISDLAESPKRFKRRSSTHPSLSSITSNPQESQNPSQNLTEYFCLNLVFAFIHFGSLWQSSVQVCVALGFSVFIFYFPQKISPKLTFWLEFSLIGFLQLTSVLDKFLFIIPFVHIYKSLEKKTRKSELITKSAFFIPSIIQYESPLKLAVEFLFIAFISRSKPVEVARRQSVLENINLEGNVSSPYIDIISRLEKSQKMLAKEKNKTSLKQVESYLKEVIKNLKNNPNIYIPTIDDITKGLDIEDKIFIKENSLVSEQFIRSSSLSVRALEETENLFYSGDELYPILKKIGKEWDFNTLFIDDCTGEKALSTCGEYVFNYFSFNSIFLIPKEVSQSLLSSIESKYLKNPYHNSCHAADVMNSFLFLCGSFINLIPSLEIFSCVIACLGHDIAHPGKNNRFLIQTKHPLAVCYNDISVLENMHSRELFTLLNQDNSNVLKNIPDYWHCRKLIVDLILATDMAKHFEFLASFRPTDKTLEEKLENFAERLEIYKLCIKASDIGHTAKNTDLHAKWCKLIVEEFYEQGDEEKELGLPVSMYCDRDKTDIRKSQAGFLKNIALPLFITLKNCTKSEGIAKNCVEQIHKNVIYWEKRKESFRMNSMMHPPDEQGEIFRTESRRVTGRK